MLSGLRKRVKKAGQPPGTPTYTGKNKATSCISVINFTETDYYEKKGTTLPECLAEAKDQGITWINVVGLNNSNLIEEVATHYHLHPLTVEDILNIEQRPKVDEFEDYLYISLKMLSWKPKTHTYVIEPYSIVLGKNFVLTFIDHETNIFDQLHERLSKPTT